MDRRLTNGLAWAGALLVIGIPIADYLTGEFSSSESTSVAVVEPQAPVAAPAAIPAAVAETPKAEAVKPAEPTKSAEAPKPAVPPVQEPQKTAGAVDSFLQSGRPLPSYISDTEKPNPTAAAPARPVIETPATATQASQQTAAAPVAPAAPAAQPAATTAPVEQVASLPLRQAPVPMPLSMRPPAVSVPLAQASAPLVIDTPTAPVVVPPTNGTDDIVSAEDLADWESGPLSEFLARRRQQSSANYVVRPNERAYQPDGFWLDEAQGGYEGSQRFDNDDEVYYLPF